MPVLRKDPVIGRWVIINAERSNRPFSSQVVVNEENPSVCPFCQGHESETPPEVYALRPDGSSPNTEGWEVRVTSNKYPALKIEGDLSRDVNGVYESQRGIGAHEVIIETPDHELAMADMSPEQIGRVLEAYRERMIDLQKDQRFKYILIFKNHGAAAGASQAHSHSQLIATPIIPKRVAEALVGSRKYFEAKRRCIYCDILSQELSERTRLVSESDNFVVLAPYAARFPFETWLVPKKHQSSFLELQSTTQLELAHVLRETLMRIKQALDNPPFNFMVHTRPVDPESAEFFHWHIEIFPKLTQVAGFEWGTGFFINHMPPEEAAKILRETDPSNSGQKDS